MKISNCVPNWLYSWVKWMRGILVIKSFEMSKTPNPVNLLISFQALRVSFQRRTLRLYTITIILFDPAIVTGNLRYAQFSFSFPSVAGVSAHSVQSTAGVSAHPVLSAARDSAPTINRFSPISNSQPVLVWFSLLP